MVLAEPGLTASSEPLLVRDLLLPLFVQVALTFACSS